MAGGDEGPAYGESARILWSGLVGWATALPRAQQTGEALNTRQGSFRTVA